VGQHLPTENSRTVLSIAALALVAGVAFQPVIVPRMGGSGTGTAVFSLSNESASASRHFSPFEAELESPNFVPARVLEFAARGYVRKNRRS